MEMHIKMKPFEMDAESMMKELNIEPGGRVQQAIDSSVIEWCVPYCPWRTGKLAMSPYTSPYPIGSGTVCYDVPYAREVYYGEKIRYFNTTVNPLAGSFWFERAMADHARDVYMAAMDALKG